MPSIADASFAAISFMNEPQGIARVLIAPAVIAAEFALGGILRDRFAATLAGPRPLGFAGDAGGGRFPLSRELFAVVCHGIFLSVFAGAVLRMGGATRPPSPSGGCRLAFLNDL